MKILVTGATGFIGQTFVQATLDKGWQVRAALREKDALPEGCESILVGDIDGQTNWSEALAGCDAVVHLAARVHVMKEKEEDPKAAFYKVNTEGTIHLAREAVKAGVSRFLFISTIKVNGEGRETAYTENDELRPEEPYSSSKADSEKALFELTQGTNMALTILRPPLVYGQSVRANFLNLMRVIECGVPLPFASIKNRRSLIYVGNLASAMLACLSMNGARGKVFVVSDGQDVSTPELIRKIAQALGKTPRLWPFPVKLMRIAASCLGKTKQVDRLLSSLFVDASALNKATGWTPPFTLEEGLERTALWFQARKDDQ